MIAACALAIVPGRGICLDGSVPPPPDIPVPPVDEDFETDPEPEQPPPLEHTPGWARPDHPGKGKGLTKKNGKAAQEEPVDDGVGYTAPAPGRDKKVEAALIEIEQQQGYIAPLVIDSENFVGTTYDPGQAKLKADKRIDGIYTALGETAAEIISGDEIGGIVRNGNYWITHNAKAVAGPFVIDAPILAEKSSGLVAKGPATEAWLDSFSSRSIKTGYGRGYGFGWGGTV